MQKIAQIVVYSLLSERDTVGLVPRTLLLSYNFHLVYSMSRVSTHDSGYMYDNKFYVWDYKLTTTSGFDIIM